MITLDAEKVSVTEINRALREAVKTGEEVELLNPRARHNLGVGILGELNMTIHGSAGYFCGSTKASSSRWKAVLAGLQPTT